MWLSADSLAATKRWLGQPPHSTFNWWNVSLASDACSEVSWNTKHSWIAVYKPKVSTLSIYLTLKAMGSFNLISICFLLPPFSSYFGLDTTLFLFLSRRKPIFSSNSFFLLACVHPLNTNTWAVFVSLALYWVTSHVCAVCLMEMLCRKRPCGSHEYMCIRNGILVSSP